MRTGLLGILLTTCLTLAAGASTAQAYVFWGHSEWRNANRGVGRAALDGTNVNDNFIPAPPGFYARSVGVAAMGGHVYWGVQGLNSVEGGYDVTGASIGRATVDGGGADHLFTARTGQYVSGLGATSTHLLWTAQNRDTSDVGRTAIGGGQQFQTVSSVSGQPNPQTCGVAADDTYMYWANTVGQSIGRTPLSNFGAAAPADPNWIQLSAGHKPCGVAVDAGHVYWGEFTYSSGGGNETAGNSVGRVNKNGTGKNESFLTGLARVNGVAVDDKYIYTSNQGSSGTNGQGFIGRGNIAGGSSGVLVGTLSQPFGVAVEDTGPSGGTAPVRPYHPPIQLPPTVCGRCSGTRAPASTKGDKPPDMSRAWSTNKVFVPASWNTPLIQMKGARAGVAAKSKRPAGTEFNFVATRAGTVRIVISSVGKGRRSGKRCVKPTRKLVRKKRRRCTRLKKVWTLTRTAKVGRNTVPFSGRVRGRALRLGRYQAAFTGVNGKRSGKKKVVAFRVARP